MNMYDITQMFAGNPMMGAFFGAMALIFAAAHWPH
jgi:hypothetical protein